ncbi:MAG: orotidine-5'-phosphate decarboxylase [Acidobacteria bacterium]|nr:orotidine-5'-phosphate decarboxylase [Acidobacteriota bacterium]
MSALEKLIVALDFPSAQAAARVAETLRGRVGMFKVGLELFAAEGPVLTRYLVATGEKIFLDLKFHDIPNTVRAAAREAAQLGVSIFNVHASGGRKMMEAAREGADEGARRIGRPRPLVVAVTVLTSLGDNDLVEIGTTGSAEEAVLRLARLARDAGLDGVVASPWEIAALRRELGRDFVIITPGIRPAAAAAGDQVRVATPAAAVQAGADYLVVGRPITAVPDPVVAADTIVAEMDRALTSG